MLYEAIVPAQSTISRIGMVAKRSIPTGTIVWHPCKNCAVWSPSEIASMDDDTVSWLEEFGYWLNDDSIVTACCSGYTFNHSCDSYLLDFGLDFSIVVRDIPDGAEVTIDYRSLQAERRWRFLCHCEADSCARVIEPTSAPSEALRAHWESRIRPALARVGREPQPLHGSLQTGSRSYRAWLETGDFAWGKYSVCDPFAGLGEPQRTRYLVQERRRIAVPQAGVDGGLADARAEGWMSR
jgi:uncharacterized protein